MPLIDKDKKYKTRSGLPVEIYTINGSEDVYPVHGSINRHGVDSWTSDGSYSIDADRVGYNDLVEAHEPREFWISVNPLSHLLVAYDREYRAYNHGNNGEVIHVREVIE